MEMAGKVVVIIGASMGIGEALAHLCADRGASVVLLSRDNARAEGARTRIGHLDRTLALSWINNAGHGLLDSIATVDMAACRDMFETNLFGAVEAMQAVIPVMEQQGAGTIINISSVAGHIPLPFHATYSATKFALNAIGKAARVELVPKNIHVMTVCPGYVRTNFAANIVRGRNARIIRPESQRGISAERVARATLNGYLKRKREVIVPWYMHIPVKIYQLFPSVVEWAMARMARQQR